MVCLLGHFRLSGEITSVVMPPEWHCSPHGKFMLYLFHRINYDKIVIANTLMSEISINDC